MNYENRIVLFIDILGFKKVIESTFQKEKDKKDEIKYLNETLTGLKNVLSRTRSRSKSDKVITQFSDSIVISFLEIDNDELYYVFINIKALIVYLISRKVICRGGISYGKLVHNKDIIFGPGLINAYETESKAASYPRIIIDKDLISNKKHQSIYEYLETSKVIARDFDQMYFIDYFTDMAPFIDRYTDIEKEVYFKNLRKLIVDGFNYNRNKPDIRTKYGWMKSKYNNEYNKKKTFGLVNNQNQVEFSFYSKNHELIK